MSIIAGFPTAGLFEDMEREDDALGPMPDESFYRLVQRLVSEDDLNRDLDEDYTQEELDEIYGEGCIALSATGRVRIPEAVSAADEAFWRLVRPTAQGMPDDSDDACPVCGNWTCTCGQ